MTSHAYNTRSNNLRVNKYMVDRKHRCDSCGTVFTCDLCSEHLQRRLARPSAANRFDVLYHLKHRPTRESGSRTPWHCTECHEARRKAS